jgi:NAD(P)-dependent dehydrogenase (short-subunit alcohol dehydrogenase family)
VTPPLAVVVGAGGGIGGALARTLAAEGAIVMAVARRRPAGWPQDETHRFAPADVTDEASLARAAAAIGAIGAPGRVIVATGLLHGPGVTPEKSYRALDPAALAQLFAVNATGPALAAKHLLPLMPRDGPHVFAALSARVGSVADNRLGGWYGYRASKAALTMLIRCLAIEHARTRPQGMVVGLHPGTVATALSAPFGGGAAQRFTPDDAAARLLAVMAGLTPADSGGVFAWDGSPVPW